ncbi:hypothetical protein E2C01_093185 [Portunus trituberculatus]|uniref:Uncharacterized protein n=1 Tax=Portunus trituberculatus TaxID=210409 RepID=A0A5B7JXY3_PORTR|nr:hypothetical protein [Portunus trituberculatus]
MKTFLAWCTQSAGRAKAAYHASPVARALATPPMPCVEEGSLRSPVAPPPRPTLAHHHRLLTVSHTHHRIPLQVVGGVAAWKPRVASVVANRARCFRRVNERM